MKLRNPLIAGILLSVAVVGPALGAPTGPKGGPKTGGSASASASAVAPPTPTADASSTAATPASSTTPTTPAGSAAAPTTPPMDGQTYAVRLRDLEQKVDDLKEQIRRSHTKLSLLSDTVLSSGSSGSRADIQFKNEMSSAFRLTKLLVVLDGAVQANKMDESGALSDQPTIPVFAGAIPPGDHTLSVLEQLQGNGYGVFSYLKGYKFEVRSSHSFTATEGKTISLSIIAYEKGGVTTALEERPAIRYTERFTTGLGGGSAPAPASSGASPVSTGFSIGTGK
ncbi:MAG: hypothetical protein U0165_13750 [Polyangiaceae bacterium]